MEVLSSCTSSLFKDAEWRHTALTLHSLPPSLGPSLSYVFQFWSTSCSVNIFAQTVVFVMFTWTDFYVYMYVIYIH